MSTDWKKDGGDTHTTISTSPENDTKEPKKEKSTSEVIYFFSAHLLPQLIDNFLERGWCKCNLLRVGTNFSAGRCSHYWYAVNIYFKNKVIIHINPKLFIGDPVFCSNGNCKAVFNTFRYDAYIFNYLAIADF
jgi:hypothetical protein